MRRIEVVLPGLAVSVWASPGLGQSDPGVDDAPPGSVMVPSDSGTVVVTPGETTTMQTYVPPPGYPQPGVDINAGLPSSSRPFVGDTKDTFDLGGSSGGSAVVYGEKGSPGIVKLSGKGVGVPAVYFVKQGDTLWDLSAHYYEDPYYWPRLWSYNPQIENPNWIYPGDQLRMRPGASLASAPGAGAGSGTALLRDSGGGAPRVGPATVFLRDQGYLGDPDRDRWGEVVGAREDQMLLSDGNRVYLMLRPGVEPRLGQELTVFRGVRPPEDVPGARRPPGEIVKVLGTIRVDEWNPETRIASGEIIESLDIIERGAKVGPVGRRFDVVPPKPNSADVFARVLTSIYPHVYMGQDQVVFIDRGSEDGLAPGNRLRVLRRGDTWRRGLKSASKMARARVVLDSQQSVEIETTPLHGDDDNFPEEVVGELRVLRAEKYSAVALVTESSREIVVGDRAVAPKGY